MDFEKLEELMKMDREAFAKRNPDMTEQETVMTRSVKIQEELGELSEQILGHYGHQRAEKAHKMSKESLQKEVGDVLMSTMLVASYFEIDIEETIEHTMERIKERYLRGK